MVKILFVCIGNSCRSQMAEGFMKHYAGDSVEVESMGLFPASHLSEATIMVMAEKGIDVSSQYPKDVSQVRHKYYDYIVLMGEEVSFPQPLTTKKVILWRIPDPINQPISIYRNVRNRIENAVLEFINFLKLLVLNKKRVYQVNRDRIQVSSDYFLKLHILVPDQGLFLLYFFLLKLK